MQPIFLNTPSQQASSCSGLAFFNACPLNYSAFKTSFPSDNFYCAKFPHYRTIPTASFSPRNDRPTRHSNRKPFSGRSSSILPQVLESQRLRKKGQWKVAKALLASVQHIAQNNVSFLNEMLHIRAAELRHLQPTISPTDLYKQLCTFSDSSPAKTNASTYNAILIALRNVSSSPLDHDRNSVLEVSSRLFNSMLDRKIIPDHFTMSIIFQMCASNRSLRHTLYFEQMAREKFAYKLSVVSGSSLVTAFAKCGQVEDVERVLKEMQSLNLPINERTYASIISVYHRISRHAKVMECFRMAMDSEFVKPNIFLFSGTLASCCRAKDSYNALGAFELLEQKGIRPTVELLKLVFDTAIRSGDIKLGMKVLFEWGPKYGLLKPDMSHFRRLISSSKKTQGPVEETVASLSKVIVRMEEEGGIKPDISVYNAWVSALIHARMFSDARRIVEYDLAKVGFSPTVATYNALIQGYGMERRTAEAVNMLHTMRKDGVKPDQITYNIVLDFLVESGDMEMGDMIRREIERDPDVYMDSAALSSLLKLYRKQGKGDEALQIHKKAVLEGRLPDAKTYSLILSTLFESGCESTAISLFGWLIWKRIAQVHTVNVVLGNTGKKAENLEKCLQILNSMKRRGYVPDAITYTTVIRICSQNGQLNRAFRLLGEMQDVGLGMSDSYAWTALIDGCGKCGQWQRGVEVFESMRASDAQYRFVPSPTTASYNAALYAAGIGGGQWKVSLDIYKALMEDKKEEADAVTYSAMASIILRNQEDVEEWDIVREVMGKLCVMEKLEGEAINFRRSRRLSGSNRKIEKPLQKKLASKAKRLKSLLDHERKGRRNKSR